MHRLILLNPRLAQRRVLFEALSIFAYTVAVALCVFNILSWKDHPSFVISCTILWAMFSASVAAKLLWTNFHRNDKKVLEVPESWDESFVNLQQDSLTTTHDTPDVVNRQTLPNNEDLRVGPTQLNNRLAEASLAAVTLSSTDLVDADLERGSAISGTDTVKPDSERGLAISGTDTVKPDSERGLAISGADTVKPDSERGVIPDRQILGRNRKRTERFQKKRNNRSAANNLGVYTQKAFVKSRCDCS